MNPLSRSFAKMIQAFGLVATLLVLVCAAPGHSVHEGETHSEAVQEEVEVVLSARIRKQSEAGSSSDSSSLLSARSTSANSAQVQNRKDVSERHQWNGLGTYMLI